MIWCGWVLWHINHCRLFNAKSSLYIYIKYIWFGWVGFYGISTIVGYLMLNPLYTYISNIYGLVGFYGISMLNTLLYILNIYDLWIHFVDNIIKWAWVIYCAWLNGFKYSSHNLTSVICLHTVCLIWPLDRTLSGATILGQSGPGSNGNQGVLHIIQSWSLTIR